MKWREPNTAGPAMVAGTDNSVFHGQISLSSDIAEFHCENLGLPLEIADPKIGVRSVILNLEES